MHLLHELLHFLQRLIALPVNVIVWAWNQPQRGRCLLWGMPAVLTLLFVLLVAIWSRTGLRNDLSNTYLAANKSTQSEIGELAKTVKERRIEQANSEPRIEQANSEAVVENNAFPNEETAVETSSASLRELHVEFAEQQIRRNIQPRSRHNATKESAPAVFEIGLDPDGRIDRVRLVEQSGDPLWDAEVEQGIRTTGRLEFEENVSIPDSLEVPFNRDTYLLDRQRLAGQVYLRKLIELNPNNLEYKYDLARSFFASGDQEKAFSLMSQVAPEDAPGLAAGHVWFAAELVKLMSNPKYRNEPSPQVLLARAVRHLENALKTEPQNFDANFGMAQILFRQNRPKEAAKFLEDLLDSASNLQVLGVTDLMVKVYTETKEVAKLNERLQDIENRLNEFWKKDPENDIFAFDLCRIYRYRGRYEEGIELLTSRINDTNREQIHGFLADYYYVWGESLQTNQQAINPEALAKFQQALEFRPRNERILSTVALLGASKRPGYEEALKIYDPVADGDNAPAIAMREVAGAWIREGRNDEALALLEKAHKKGAGDPIIANNLAFLLLSADPPDPERALKLSQTALENYRRRNGRDQLFISSLLDTRAAALAQLDRYQEAIANWQSALRLRPGDVRFMTSLRDAYLAVQLPELAEKMERQIEAAKQTKSPAPGQ